MFEEITESTVLEETGYQRGFFDDSDVQMNEFEFTAELVVELPEEVEPEKFFGYLMRVMIAHTEAYGGFMGGATKWNRYEANEDE